MKLSTYFQNRRAITVAVITGAVIIGGAIYIKHSLLSSGSEAIKKIEYLTPSSAPIPVQEVYPYTVPKPTQLVEVAWNDQLTKYIAPDCPQQYCVVTLYDDGKIKTGTYAGKELYLAQISDGPGVLYYHVVLEGNKKIYLESEGIGFKGVSDLPDQISLPGSDYKLKKNYVARALFSEIKKARKVFTDPQLGDFYLSLSGGCLVVELPDHTTVSYDPILSFINRENGLLNATFSNGQKNNEEYTYTRITGCGDLCYSLATVDEVNIKAQDRLMVVGKLSNGEDIYSIKDAQDFTLKEIYNDKNTVAYMGDNYGPQRSESKYTYDQFIAYHPVLYWKDPLGRWVEFLNERFIQAAEMCKPVIYLYPMSTTNVDVKVYPNGGFTYTDPRYDEGWSVQARPDGNLVDLRTGKKYDYLFWEGVSLHYPIDDNGWVIAQKDLDTFLTTKLTLLGLRGRELVDFKKYWLTRLTDRPYYQLSFLDQSQFNQLAPLEVSGHPSTVIRIMMTVEGLDQIKSIPAQDLKASIARHGFTVIEWGGVVLK